jgi:hypothetical protein
MSNQAYSNRILTSRYNPANAQRDVFRIIQPNPPTFGGYQSANITPTGQSLYWDNLNGNNVTKTAGIANYPLFQSVNTKDFWTLSANDAAHGGGLLLYSRCDNVIAVTCSFQFGVNGGVDSVPVKFAIDKLDAAFNVIDVYNLHDYPGGVQREVGVPATRTYVMNLSATIRIAQGQILIICGYSGNTNTYPLVFGDGVNASSTAVFFPAILEFAKM